MPTGKKGSPGRPAKGGTDRAMIHVRLTPELHRKVRVKAAEANKSIQQYVEGLLERE